MNPTKYVYNVFHAAAKEGEERLPAGEIKLI
jgi:hypothetical protein